jgi:MoxR-like ATPase
MKSLVTIEREHMTDSAVDLATEQVQEFTDRVQAIRESLHSVVVGQDETVDQLLICALTGSHSLLVGVPGLAKTLIVKAHARLNAF